LSVLKFSILLSQVVTLLKTWNQEKLWQQVQKKSKVEFRTYNSSMYFNYFPINTNISIIAKINAVVEKLAGKIRIRVTNTGSQSSHRRLKSKWFFSSLDK
jgi:hypothetical protein